MNAGISIDQSFLLMSMNSSDVQRGYHNMNGLLDGLKNHLPLQNFASLLKDLFMMMNKDK